MAEALIYDDSPMAEYLEETGADEQALLELSARMPPPPPRSPSVSSLSTRNSKRFSSSSASSANLLSNERSPALPTSPSEYRSSFESPRDAVRLPPQIKCDSDGKRKSNPGSSASRSPRIRTRKERKKSVEPPTSASPHHDKSIRDRKGEPLEWLSHFVRDLGAAMRGITMDVFLPLLIAATQSVWATVISGTTLADEPGQGSGSPIQPPVGLLLRKDSGSATKPGGFSERFKFIVCTSFLLTPSLSISFYDSEPPAPEPAEDPPSSTALQIPGPDPVPIRVHSNVTFGHASKPVAQHGPTRSPLPSLNPDGATIRNGALLSVALLAILSRTWDLWFRCSLAIAALAWSMILLLNLSETDETVSFELSHRPRLDALPYLRFGIANHESERREKKRMQREAIREAKTLVKAAQSLDVAVNKAINAVQEVELVSRGYKISHPLPPISRIEASGSTAWPSNQSASPPRARASMMPVINEQGARLSRSSSTGASMGSNGKHAQRPISTSVPMAGRASSAFSGELLDGEWNRRGTTSAAAAHDSIEPPRRLIPLRQLISSTLEEVGAVCREATAELEPFTDRDELNLLKDMYSLESAGASITGTDTELYEPVGSPREAPRSPRRKGRSSLDELFAAGAYAGKRTSWTATTPRNFGSKRQSIDSSFGGSRFALDERNDAPLSSISSPPGRKRLSLLSDGASTPASVLDRAQAPASAPAKRESFSLDPSLRSPRIQYVSDKTGITGPNESAVSKRLSYASTGSGSGSISARSPFSLQAQIAAVGTNTTPSRSGSPSMSAALRRSDSRKRSSVLGPSSLFQNETLSQKDEAPDPQSLLGLKHSFESAHSVRRSTLCHLLALDFSMKDPVRLGGQIEVGLERHWELVIEWMRKLSNNFGQREGSIQACLKREMGTNLGESGRDTTTKKVDDLLPPALAEGINTSGASGLEGHLGLQDRFNVMAILLRSVQAKLRSCCEDIRVKPPLPLHGTTSDASEEQARADTILPDTGATLKAENLERVFEGIREDLLALSAEWEAGLKILRKERGRVPSPSVAATADEITASNLSRDLESPLEAEEDEEARDKARDRAVFEAGDGGADVIEADGETEEGSIDNDLAALLLRSTSPKHLPPPGLEQVFESIAGLAGSIDFGRSGGKPSREERIKEARRKREEAESAATEARARAKATGPDANMVVELKDVIRSRKSLQQPPQPPPPPAVRSALGGDGRGGLGSPLDLGVNSLNGAFDGAPLLSADAKMTGVALTQATARETTGVAIAPESNSPPDAYRLSSLTPSSAQGSPPSIASCGPRAIDWYTEAISPLQDVGVISCNDRGSSTSSRQTSQYVYTGRPGYPTRRTSSIESPSSTPLSPGSVGDSDGFEIGSKIRPNDLYRDRARAKSTNSSSKALAAASIKESLSLSPSFSSSSSSSSIRSPILEVDEGWQERGTFSAKFSPPNGSGESKNRTEASGLPSLIHSSSSSSLNGGMVTSKGGGGGGGRDRVKSSSSLSSLKHMLSSVGSRSRSGSTVGGGGGKEPVPVKV
ncbi:hypothetical protein IE53DRAFT_380024 [Violaceomyces palustris]|uniref:Uncharacterized protein n=1 Tax=Violaceomyces palustris TaxID=1673888 RepID=A0ACD0NWJ8_9BASI|nr:hypothetical protein IE53DRAFT_380024 [Violaceomyces palustris]